MRNDTIGSTYHCDICEEDIVTGDSYKCERCDYDMCFTCANQNNNVEKHEHNMFLDKGWFPIYKCNFDLLNVTNVTTCFDKPDVDNEEIIIEI